MQKYLIFILTLAFFQTLSAQEEALDSNGQKEDIRLKDLHWIKDTAYGVFKTMKFSNLKVLYPSYKTYRKYIDTSVAGSQSDVTQFAMYNNFWNRLRIQYTKMINKAYKAGIEWDKTSLDSFKIDTGNSGGNEFAYVHWIIRYNNKRRYHFSALFLKMRNKWYLMDELKFVGLVPEPKKKKKKK